MTSSVLFVCTANRVRSPFAAAVAGRLVAEHALPVDVSSAGFLGPGHPADSDMAHVARKRGLDLSDHTSRHVDADLLERSDLIVAMTGEHDVDLVGLSPDATRRILTLRELGAAAEAAQPSGWDGATLREWADGPTRRPMQDLLGGSHDTPDPMGRSMRRYRAAADEIEALVTAFFTPRRP